MEDIDRGGGGVNVLVPGDGILSLSSAFTAGGKLEIVALLVGDGTAGVNWRPAAMDCGMFSGSISCRPCSCC